MSGAKAAICVCLLITLSLVMAITFGIISDSTSYQCGYSYGKCKMQQKTRIRVSHCTDDNQTHYCCDQDCWYYRRTAYCGDDCCQAQGRSTIYCSQSWATALCVVFSGICIVSSCCVLCSGSKIDFGSYKAPKRDLLAEQRQQQISNQIRDNQRDYRRIA